MRKLINFDKAFARKAIVLAIPLMLQSFVSVAVNLVDNLMVGALGDAAIGSVAAVNKYYMIASFAINGLAMAGSVFIAQFYGAGETKKMKQSFRTMLLFSTGIMSLFTLFALIGSRQIIAFFTTDPEIIVDGILYIRIAAWSFLPVAITMTIYNAMRAVGETKLPLFCSVTAVLINAVLNYVLMFGKFGFPRMEVAGAAMATLIARCIEVGLALIFLYRRPFDFKTKLSHIHHVPADLMRRVLAKAAPLMLNEILWSFGMAMLFKFYSTRGPEVMSGYSICGTVGDLFFSLFAGMSAATTVLISQPLGANRLDEARENGYKLICFSMFLAVIMGILMFNSARVIPFLYRNITPAAQNVAIRYLHVQSFMFWNYMATAECYFILRAGGDMKHTLLMDSGFMWLLNIPFLAFITYRTDFDYLQIYLAGQLTDFLKLMFSLHVVRKEHWVVNLTVEDKKSV